MIKIGVLGAGDPGRVHLQLLKEILYYDVAGFYDPDDSTAGKAMSDYGLKRFHSVDELAGEVDAIDLITPRPNHFECASRALKLSRHLFIENPLHNTIREARSLRALAAEADVKVQLGHVERFNPAFLAAKAYLKNPMYIEAKRYARFDTQRSDTSVVLDLMIHDIDIVLSVVRSNIKRISASGVAVVSDTPDIVNARIEFDNGCVANLSASRISVKEVTRTRFYQKDDYVSVDFLKKEAGLVHLENVKDQPDAFSNGQSRTGAIRLETLSLEPVNAIKMELTSFAESILNNTDTAVGIEDGCKALEVAFTILEKIHHTTDFLRGNAISA